MENSEKTVSELKEKIIEEKEELEKKEEIKDQKSEEKKEENVKSKKRHKWLIPVIIIALALIVLSTGFALTNINNKKIIAGVTIDKINMQGLNKEQATKVINDKVQEKLNTEIKVLVNEEENSILLSQIELEYLVDETIEQAYQIGRNSNILVNNYNIIKSKLFGTNVNLNYNYNEELLNSIINDIKGKIPGAVKQVSYCIEDDELILTKGTKGLTINDEIFKTDLEENIDLSTKKDIILNTYEIQPEEINIEKIYTEVHTEAKDAYYTTNPFQIYPEVIGIDFDIEKAKEIIKEDKEEYIIPLAITKPNKTVNDIGTEAFPDLLSVFTTRYDASNTSRTTNLKIAINKLNGIVVMPGQVCSYNKTLGKRTAEAGYRDAAGYAGGKVVPMIGGGICQISSTLYNAVVYANLEIVERHNHAFLTSYVGAGKDATVVYGSLDFKFKNTRKYPITIKASISNGIAKIEIYGVKEENEYDVEIVTSILSTIPFVIKYENDASMPEGTEKVTQGGMNGCKSITYKILKQNGKEISRSVLSTDTYDAMNKYISRGTKGSISTEPVEPISPVVPEQPTQPEEPATPEPSEEPTTPEKPEIPEVPIEPTMENII